ncbi:transglycosylase, partial [Stenotrophomonas sp. HMWF003]
MKPTLPAALALLSMLLPWSASARTVYR